ncbi:MAG TPA: hypothetical protein VKX49_18495 [Bryobacteraceae bacterium]|nr:hypothetical protein [Bryobacteraceae bacterium]
MSRFRLLMILGLSGITALVAQPPTPTPVTREIAFPPVGLAAMETMQVNIANTAANAASGTAASCTGSVSFLDSTGKAIAGTGGTFTVASGVTQSMTLLGSKANTTTTNGSRAEVRVVISFNMTRGTPCALADSLETFDPTTGFTHVYLTGGTVGSLPVPVAVLPRN